MAFNYCFNCTLVLQFFICGKFFDVTILHCGGQVVKLAANVLCASDEQLKFSAEIIPERQSNT